MSTSTTLGSQDKVQLRTVPMASAPFLTIGRCSPTPTARIADCGGFITAENSLIPYIPKFEIEKLPP